MTNRLSKLIDILLQPFLNKIKSFIRDNIQFLNSIPLKIDSNILIVTFDITNLYSNIPHGLGIKAVSFWIDKYPEILHPRFNKKFITEGIELILDDNSFQFDNRNYIQTLGTAMRTKISSTHATITLAFLEENLYEIIGKNTMKIYKENLLNHRRDT